MTYPIDDGNFARGGHGLYSTLDDYFRFAQMLLNGGELNGVRLLSPRSIELMASDHLTEEEKSNKGKKLRRIVSHRPSRCRRPPQKSRISNGSKMR